MLTAFSKPNSIFRKFTQRSKNNKLLKTFNLISFDADLEWVFIDATHVRAHQHATSIRTQAISKSMGGNSSKTHLTVDSNENPIQFLIHDGTSHNVKVATALVNPIGLKDTDVLCTNKGYDANLFREKI